MTDTYARVADALETKFNVDRSLIRRDAALQQLGLDSLALMEFVFEVEDRFRVRIPEDKLDPRQAGVTLGQLADLLDAEMQRADSPAAEAKSA
jgi:acyl carrier protein